MVAATGSQNVTFSYADYGFKQRIDVHSKLGGTYREILLLLGFANCLTSILEFCQAAS